LHDRIVVQRLVQGTKTGSGIIILEQASEKPDPGVVKHVGKGKVGDDELLVMRKDDVMAGVE